MTAYFIAQCNIARGRERIDHPLMADFNAQLNTINALAESSPGFVWRLRDDSNNATSIQVFDDPHMIVNMSVWKSIDALFAFTFHTNHLGVLQRRAEWFERMDYPHLALWWLPATEPMPNAEHVKVRLDHLHAQGPTSFAFTFQKRFPIPAEASYNGSNEQE